MLVGILRLEKKGLAPPLRRSTRTTSEYSTEIFFLTLTNKLQFNLSICFWKTVLKRCNPTICIVFFSNFLHKNTGETNGLQMFK